MDDEYAWAGVEDPKIVVTTSHSPSSRLKQFAKVRQSVSQLSSSQCGHVHVGRALCLECRVSWVRVPPEAAHFF